MATMDPGQRGFGQQRQFNIPDLPFSTPGNMDRFLPSSHRGRGPGGMRPQGPVDRFDESMGERSRGGQIPPELLEMLMAMLMGGQGGRRATPMPTSPPMPPGGRRATPMPSRRGGQRPPMGGGRPPVIKIEDLVRALSGGGGQRQAPQANMPVPQARR